MGWWPFSSSSNAAPPTSQQPQSAQSTPSSIPTPSPTTPTSSAPHDPDFYAAHPHLAPPSLPTTNSPSDATHAAQEEDLDPMLPRTMSCRAAFDSAFYCSSFGGHFNDIYRYGQLRSCSDHWSDFWFCMRTKNAYMSSEAKERAIQDRYREKEEKTRTQPNSEDIWVKRRPGEEVKEPFKEAEREWERVNADKTVS